MVPVAAHRGQWLKTGHNDLLCRNPVDICIHGNNYLALPCLAETHRYGRPRIAAQVRAAHPLRQMQMAQSKICETIGKGIGAHLAEGADIQFPHPVPFHGLAAAGEQVPHGHNGKMAT